VSVARHIWLEQEPWLLLFHGVSTVIIFNNRSTYRTPKLMAIHTPSFSAKRIWSFHNIFQGKSASEMSISAAQTAWKRAYCRDGCLSMHVPGSVSIKVFVIGLHSTQGRTAAGIANIAKVAIAKYTYNLSHPSVNRSNVTPNDILLKVIAATDTESADAP
jgi:hypothetical protein